MGGKELLPHTYEFSALPLCLSAVEEGGILIGTASYRWMQQCDCSGKGGGGGGGGSCQWLAGYHPLGIAVEHPVEFVVQERKRN